MKQPKISNIKIDVKGTKAMRELMAKRKKIKITVNVDQDVLLELRKMAKQSGTPYQSLLNHLLKESVTSKRNEKSRLDRLEKEVELLKKKVSA